MTCVPSYLNFASDTQTMSHIVQILDRRIIVAEIGNDYVQVSRLQTTGPAGASTLTRSGIDAQHNDAETVSVLMPWIVAPARTGTRRGFPAMAKMVRYVPMRDEFQVRLYGTRTAR